MSMVQRDARLKVAIPKFNFEHDNKFRRATWASR